MCACSLCACGMLCTVQSSQRAASPLAVEYAWGGGRGGRRVHTTHSVSSVNQAAEMDQEWGKVDKHSEREKTCCTCKIFIFTKTPYFQKI